MIIQATRYHDFSAGHRVVGHEGKCQYWHGHNYRAHFFCEAPLDHVGRVLDFGVIKEKLCLWLEANWDHRFLAWSEDPMMYALMEAPNTQATYLLARSVVWVPFNPTAENMAAHLLHTIGPKQLEGSGVNLIRVIVEETRRCSAVAQLGESACLLKNT